MTSTERKAMKVGESRVEEARTIQEPGKERYKVTTRISDNETSEIFVASLAEAAKYAA